MQLEVELKKVEDGLHDVQEYLDGRAKQSAAATEQVLDGLLGEGGISKQQNTSNLLRSRMGRAVPSSSCSRCSLLGFQSPVRSQHACVRRPGAAESAVSIC